MVACLSVQGWTCKTDPRTGRSSSCCARCPYVQLVYSSCLFLLLRAYYVHAQNKLRQWKKPERFDPATAVAAKADFAVQQTVHKNVPKADAEATSTVSVSAASSNWIRKTDPKSGRIYYVDVLTKKTQWKACSFSSCFFVSCVALIGWLRVSGPCPRLEARRL